MREVLGYDHQLSLDAKLVPWVSRRASWNAYGSHSVSWCYSLSAWSTRVSFGNLSIRTVVAQFDSLAAWAWAWAWGMRPRCKFWEQHMMWLLWSSSSLIAMLSDLSSSLLRYLEDLPASADSHAIKFVKKKSSLLPELVWGMTMGVHAVA